MVSGGEKAEDAFRTIGELSAELGIQQHILRYWETRFPQLRPLQRAGNRRYYRPSDAVLVRRIHSLLNEQGYTIRGVQKLLSQKSGSGTGSSAAGNGSIAPPAPPAPPPIAPAPVLVVNQPSIPPSVRAELMSVRDSLIKALAADME